MAESVYGRRLLRHHVSVRLAHRPHHRRHCAHLLLYRLLQQTASQLGIVSAGARLPWSLDEHSATGRDRGTRQELSAADPGHERLARLATGHRRLCLSHLQEELDARLRQRHQSTLCSLLFAALQIFHFKLLRYLRRSKRLVSANKFLINPTNICAPTTSKAFVLWSIAQICRQVLQLFSKLAELAI